MLRKLWYACSGSQPAQFESRLPLEPSVRRLGEDTSPWDLSLRERAVGTVSAERVKLWRRRSYWRGRGYGPVFKGRFEQRGGRIVLVGQFAGTRLVQAWIVLWSAFMGISAWLEWTEWSRNPDYSAVFVIAPAALAVLGLAMTAIVGKEARDNVAWLSDHIRSRLQG